MIQKKTCKFHLSSDKSHTSNHTSEEQAFYRGAIATSLYGNSLSNYKKGGRKSRRRKHSKKSKRKGRKTRRK